MYQNVRNLLLAGLGAAVLTRDKVLEATRQLVEQGRMSAAEAERVADEVVEESRRQAKGLGEKLDAGARRAVEALDLVNRQELDHLAQRVAELERALAQIQQRLAGDAPSAPADPPDR